ncbi:MAG: hypothetical protein JST91_14840 [Actinobacteria bacterium]|nr:hypothetical protein [Actinomycetota bacterium]
MTSSESSAGVPGSWTALAGAAGVHVGQVAPPRRVAVSAERVELLRSALRAALGDTDAPLSLADICPDPLVFALESGLPRPLTLGRMIDGGSTWTDLRPVGDDQLFAVSAVAEIVERTTRDGRRLVRIVYRTEFTDSRGVAVGTAAGTSLHVGELL